MTLWWIAGPAKRSERDVVVQVGIERGGGGARLRARCAAEIIAATLAIIVAAAKAGAAPAAAVEQDQLAAEALQHDLGRIAVGARLVLPFAGLDLALQIDLGALLQIGFGDAAEILVEDDDAVPFGPLLAVAVAVLPILGSRDAHVHHLAAIVQRADFGIVAQIADQYNLVHPRHRILLES